MKKFKNLAALATGIAAVFVFAVVAYAATTVIHPGDMDGWSFVQETPTGSGAMVNGPGTPPLGDGSANLVVDSTGGVILAKAAYQGLGLDEIDNLEYSTYRTTGGPALAIALQFNFDGDVTDANNAFQGRLVYEPYHTQTVNTGEWQTWNPLNDAAGLGTGNWWFSNGAHAASSTCTMATPCTWAEVLTAFPDGGVHNTLGAVILKAGGGWTGGFNGNVDALTVNGDTYDFELTNDPINKDECKNGGWEAYGFSNQGRCIQFVNTGIDSR
jgi:hypothetical protein